MITSVGKLVDLMVDAPGSRSQQRACRSPLQGRIIGVRIAGISRAGFCLTAILVVMLWCLVVTNRLIIHRANVESSRALRGLKYLRLQNSAQPGKSYENPPDDAEPRRRMRFISPNNIRRV
jgi:hypothetical protein